VLGDAVNLSARLMQNAPQNGILVNTDVYESCKAEINFRPLNPIKVKGKDDMIPIFEPNRPESVTQVGFGPSKEVTFPWTPQSTTYGGSSVYAQLADVKCFNIIRTLLGDRNAPDDVGNLDIDLFSTYKKGTLTLYGHPGTGKHEICEYIVNRAIEWRSMLPVFGSSNGRPGRFHRVLLAVELVVSTLLGFQHFVGGLAEQSCIAGVKEVLGGSAADFVTEEVEQVFTHLTTDKKDFHGEVKPEVIAKCLDLAVEMVQRLADKCGSDGLLVVLRTTQGTSYYSYDDPSIWYIANKLHASKYKIIVVLMLREPDDTQPCIMESIIKGWHIQTYEWEYKPVKKYIELRLKILSVPDSLTEFIYQVSKGRIRYIIETLDQLIHDKHIEITQGKCILNTEDMDTIKIADWTHTAMVGGAICLIESFDPQESTVAKMATVFQNSFSIQDLSASMTSVWNGGVCLDFLRLMNAADKLTKKEVLSYSTDKVLTPEEIRKGKRTFVNPTQKKDSAIGSQALVREDDGESSDEGDFNKDIPKFYLHDVLMRKVAGTMLLEQQKLAVKRAALMQRAVSRKLPSRMRKKQQRDAKLHVPYSFEMLCEEGLYTPLEEPAVGRR